MGLPTQYACSPTPLIVRGRVDSASSSFAGSPLAAGFSFSSDSALAEWNCFCQNVRGETVPAEAMATLTDLLGEAVRKRHCDITKPAAGCVLGLVSCTGSPCTAWISARVSTVQGSGLDCFAVFEADFCAADKTPAR